MVLIGTSDERTGTTLTELYRTTCLTSPAFAVMSLINAEITKISLNCFVTMKISYANNLAAICEQVPEANVDVITAAIGADTRVGSKCLKGGLGFGGPCFPRDNIAFQAFATEYGVDALLGNAVVKINKNIPIRLLNKIKGHLKPPAKVALLGLSYKPDTHIIEESHSILLANALIDAGYQVALYDSIAVNAAMDLFGNSVSFSSCPYDCVSGAEVIVLLTDWPEFHCLDWLRIGTLCAPRALVLDSWRTAIKADMSAFTYIPIGVGIH
jgi:UDPglucose 6-dehydrogenase